MINKKALFFLFFIIIFLSSFFVSSGYFDRFFYYENLDLLLNYEDELDQELRNDYVELIRVIENSDPDRYHEVGGVCNMPINN